MVFTEEHIQAIKNAALPIEFGSITVHIGALSKFLDIDVHIRSKISKEPCVLKDNKKY